MVDSKDSNFTFIDNEDPVLGKCLSVLWGHPEFCAHIQMILDQGDIRLSKQLLKALIEVKILHNREFNHDR